MNAITGMDGCSVVYSTASMCCSASADMPCAPQHPSSPDATIHAYCHGSGRDTLQLGEVSNAAQKRTDVATVSRNRAYTRGETVDPRRTSWVRTEYAANVNCTVVAMAAPRA